MGHDADSAAGVTGVDLFSGGGGAALGLRRAGVRCLAHVEWDKHACATLRAAEAAGLIDGDVIEGDIRAVDWAPYAGVDLVWASPPCQAWSSAGRRKGPQDERNGWPWMWDAVDKIRPTWLICENVTGLLHHLAAAHTRTVPGTPGLFGDGEPTDVYDSTPNPDRCARCYWDLVILPEARRRFAHVEYRVIDCADLGVPQHRERLILVCGPEPYRWPAMTHRDPELVHAAGPPWVTMRQGLRLGSYAPTGPEPWRLDRPSPSVLATEVKGYSGGGAHNGRGDAPNRASDAWWRATGVRRLAPAECAALQSFPPDYPWKGTKEATYFQIGNACPPPLVDALARQLVTP